MNMLWLCFAGGVSACFYFNWRVAERWNMLLRRSGKTSDESAFWNGSKMARFAFSEDHRRFDDTKLSQLVYAARVSFITSLLLAVGWVSLARLNFP
jgi:hypothetical protein